MAASVLETRLEPPPLGEMGYTVVVQAPERMWRQQNGLAGVVKWAVFEVQGYETANGLPIYWKQGETTGLPGTHDWEQAEPVATGSVKWDGCCNFETEQTAHVCNARDMAAFCRALERAYRIGLEMVGATRE